MLKSGPYLAILAVSVNILNIDRYIAIMDLKAILLLSDCGLNGGGELRIPSDGFGRTCQSATIEPDGNSLLLR